MKKTISVILSIITCFLIFTLCTPVTLAASYNGTCDGSIAWSLDTVSGVLTISGNGDMPDFSMSSTPGWDRYQNYVKSVVFSNGVSSVGACTFYNGGKGYKYKKLTSVDLGEVEIIGEYAFRGCAFIETITNTDNVILIDNYAFTGCSSLTDFPFSTVATVGNGSFYACTGLTALSFPSNIRKIGSAAFEKCSSVSSITLPAQMTSIGDRAFADCTAVTDVTFNSRSVSTVGEGVFGGSGTDSGATLTIANNIGTIPAKMFSYFTGLNTVQGGNSISTIGDEAFAHTGITSFHFGPGVSTLSESAFADTMSLEAFTVDTDNENYTVNSEGILFNNTGKQLVKYPGGKTDIAYTIPSTVTSIKGGAFRESKYLRTFTAGSSVSEIPGYCFINSPSLTAVSLASSVKTIKQYAFAGCKALSSISMTGITTIQNYAFAQCEALPSFTASTSLKNIGDYAFFDCDGLTSVTINSGTASSPASIGKYAFHRCDGIHDVSIGSTVSTVSEGAFSFCSAISSVSLAHGIETVGKYAFVDCPALMSVRVPLSVTSIGQYAFGYKDASSSSATAINGFRLYCYSGSAAYTYASGGGLPYEFVTDSASESVITDSDTTEVADSSVIASWLTEISQMPVINWLISIFSKIYRFFAGLIK